ncbi:MAG: hypothetical protein JXR91_00815 [Deltaproteobacteria bacterium]|nr:hypothetical protein [Deltaproteobacteria bacterium]
MKKINLILIITISILTAACAARKNSSTTPTANVKTDFAPVEIPEEITPQNIQTAEMELFYVEDKNPARLVLRDKLIDYNVKQAIGLKDEAADKKLELFKRSLKYHSPSDFRSSRVSLLLEPLAKWVVAYYEPQGKEAIVLAGLMVLSLEHPETTEYAGKYNEILNWSESVRTTITDPIEQFTSISSVYNDLVELVPEKEIIERLSGVLAKRQRAVIEFLQLFSDNQNAFPPYLFQAAISKGGIGREFVHAWFAGDYLELAVDKMDELDVTGGIDDEIVNLLQQLNEKKSEGYNYYQLAGILGAVDSASAVRACIKAENIEPANPRYSMCTAHYFAEMSNYSASVKSFKKAIESSDDEKMTSHLLGMMREVLYHIHSSEDVEISSNVSSAVNDAVAAASYAADKLKDDVTVAITSGALVEMAANIEFDDSFIEKAEEHFKLASKIWPSNPTPFTRLADIYNALGDYENAIKMLSKGITSNPPAGGNFKDFWKAIMLEQRGDNYRDMGNSLKSADDYKAAVETWNVADYPMEQAAAVAIRRGILSTMLGEENSFEFFRQAIKVDPERRASYADIISFLINEGDLDHAKEFYSMAFNQDRLDSMWKIYFSIWIEGLSLVKESKSFDLAKGYLQNSGKESWQDKLAMFFSGKIDSTQLRSYAVNKGQLTEADYYEGLYLLAHKDEESAKTLFQKVIDSNMLAFFEYKMAKKVLMNLKKQEN